MVSMLRICSILLLCLALSASLLHAGRGQWTSEGPADEPVAAIAVASSDPRIVYASSASELWRSGDGGATWAQTALTGFQVMSAVVDRSDPNTIYASGLPVGISELPEVLTSADGGESWVIVLQEPGGGLYDLTIPVRIPALSTRDGSTRPSFAERPGAAFCGRTTGE